ncbi:mucin-2 [Topomyia yanbarensis]|uniref:mucin-2 n=1 Tax=Topomyia yanbarensis TaxID=2498891 RepID=UPI00273BD598|nr:mucin-2 [Topomyia yanbarensis]
MAIDVAKRSWYPVLLFVLNLSCLHAGERWSRQLTEFGNNAGNDWIPLSQPCPTCRPGDRQAGAKVLNFFDSSGFLGNDNSAQPQHHHFTFVNQPFPAAGQSNRFPPAPVAQPLQQDFESAFNQPFGSHQSFLQQSPFGGIQTIQRHPLPPYSPEPSTKNVLVQEKPSILEQQQQQFPFPLQQHTQGNNLRQPLLQTGQNQPGSGVSQEEVQLLYVPVETLYNQKPAQQETNRYNAFPQPVSASLINDFYTSVTTTPKPRTTQTPYTTKTTTTAPQPTKPKPNQPPLAMFMYNDDKQSKITISDALGNLKNVNEIAVLDSLSKNLPKVFIGPSGLAPPKGYSKFELPYLSSIEQNRFDRKLDSLPFFVAPLSYKTPTGFSKIPLPAPHVGSVIVQQANSSPASNYYRQPENIEYYQPATLKFTEATTKPTITLPSTKSQYDSGHYTSPSNKQTTDRTNYSRGNTQTPQESYRQPQTERALHSHSPFNSVNNQPNRHIVNEEYFNLAKTKKPTTPTTSSLNYSPKTYKPFEFKPIPDQKIPLFGDSEQLSSIFTTPQPETTTEKVHPSRQQDTQPKPHIKEENFRNRRPYSAPTVAPQYEEDENADSLRNNHEEEHFVHKFKLVNSVRPQNTQTTKTVVDNAFLEFFHQDNRDMLKTVVNNDAPSGGPQTIRNNYFQPNTNDDTPKQKFVSTYYVPTTTPVTARTTTTTVPPKTTVDAFFEDFEEKSRLFESDRPRFPQQSRQPESSYNSDSYVNQFSENSYINKYKYETNTNDETHYPVEVVTTQDPLRYDTTSETSRLTTPPSNEQSYSIPSELPPISANLPGLVNSLMEDEWSPQKNTEQKGASGPATSTTAKGHFRKTVHRTSTAPVTADPYVTEMTTRRHRGRRPTSSSTYSDSTAPTRSTTINRSRSRYVPSSDEKPVGRGRVRTRLHSSSRVAKEEENLDYQRDVLKQNYPVIRPSSHSTTTTSPPPPPPPPPSTTPSTTTTHATTMPLTYSQIFEEQTDRLNLYPMTQTEHIPEVPTNEEVSNPKKETYYSENYESEATSPFAPTTIHQNGRESTVQQDDESVRVLPVNYHQVEQQRETPVKSVEVQREQPVYSTRRQHPVKQEEVETPASNHQDDGQDIRKVEITPRPRRPLSRQSVYSPRTTIATERATTERTTTESLRGSSQRRPAFVRRPGRPLYTTTTTGAPTTTYFSRGVSGDDEQPTQGAFTVRPKTRQDILRARTRRPLTTYATPTTTASPEPSVTRGFARTKELRRVSPTIRSRQEQPQQQLQDQSSEKPTETQTPRFRIRERTRFSLQPQESQWSTKLTQNSFQPVQSVESRHKNYEEEHQSIEPEPEIVTASPYQEEKNQLVNVSANLADAPTTPAGVVTKEVALSQMPPQADDSNVPSFAELLNDVMKEYIDENIQPEVDTESKPVENEVLNNGERTSTEAQRPSTTTGSNEFERQSHNIRNGYNFRKRGRAHAVDSFETAESQHINSHVFNTAGYGPLKNIDKAYLRGKNLVDDAKRINYVTPESNAASLPAQMELVGTTVLPPPETTTLVIAETTPAIETTSFLPTEKETTTPPPTVSVQLGEDEQASTEQFYDDDAEIGQEDQPPNKEATNEGIFADVKKQLSDLFAMAESDPDSEETEDDERFAPLMVDHQALERMTTSTAEPESITSTTTELTPSDSKAESPISEPVQNAMGSMAIPTSTSNGITHETEICYRGRCVKTDEKKQKKNKFKPN